VVVTAGGTREPLDPVRYLGNRSSGKMGLALAGEARGLGAEVTLITTVPAQGLDVIQVETADEMRDAVIEALTPGVILIMAAAVADWRPKQFSNQKLKKTGEDSTHSLTLDLVPTADVLLEVAKHRLRPEIFVVGFAAETENLAQNAQTKLDQKNLDMIVANDVAAADSGIGSDYNAVTIFGRDGSAVELPRAAKTEIARQILERVAVSLS
jgi:phosphopantothenoylcysteine decarboxylase/phosphopantothenate--cysteine ligase